MDSETRETALSGLFSLAFARIEALETVARLLIATHPNPAAVLANWEREASLTLAGTEVPGGLSLEAQTAGHLRQWREWIDTAAKRKPPAS